MELNSHDFETTKSLFTLRNIKIKIEQKLYVFKSFYSKNNQIDLFLFIGKTKFIFW